MLIIYFHIQDRPDHHSNNGRGTGGRGGGGRGGSGGGSGGGYRN